jgi:ribokinase
MKILNFGSLNFDYVYDVDHMVSAGETLSSYDMNVFCGGKGLNQSIALAKAGVPVYMAGMVGENGQKLIDTCKENSVDASYVKMVDGESGHAIIQVDKNAHNCILLYNGSNYKLNREYIDIVLDNFGPGDILLLQNEINLLNYIIDKADSKRMFIILNPSPCNEKLLTCDLSKIGLFILNEIEGAQISGEHSINKIPAAMRQKYPGAKIVLTLGEAGSIYCDKDLCYKQDSFKVHAVDTTAAGDTFTGYFIAGLIDKMPIKDILSRCAKAASITVSRKGAVQSIPSLEELQTHK